MNPLARLLSALVGIALLVTSYLVPSAVSEATVPSSEFSIDVDPLPLNIVCPGSFVEVAGRSGTEIGKIERVGSASVKVRSSAETDYPTAAESFISLNATGADQSTELLSAIEYQVVDESRAKGLLAGYCEQPKTNGWFVSGEGGAGKETVLIATNPNNVDTQLLVEIHFAGKVITERFVIGPLREELISLAALVGVEPSYAVYFESGGAGLVVAIQHRYSDGLNSLGVSLDTAVREASKNLWLGPLRILAEGYERPRLRIFAPLSDAAVSITYHSASTNTLTQEFSLASGELLELEPELATNDYAVEIESSEPVIASVLNPSLTPLDYQWISSLERFTSLYLPIPTVDTEIALINPGSTSLDINLGVRSAAGVESTIVRVAPNGIQMLPVTGTRLSLQADGEFMAALQLRNASGYAVINPSENANPGQSLSVFVR
ncbi:MAG: hypothetical protein RL537_625 [Actinomycetota bacterium]